MDTEDKTICLTTAQAIIRFLACQYIKIDGVETRVCGGGFGIFGHGNVPCLGEALYDHKDVLPLYRGQNEQGMGFAAAAYAKYHLRQRFMFCTASAGPGTANLLTAAALCHANRLPMLMLCGDTFLTRLPDPVLQQLEHFGNPALGLNDAFQPVSRYWDRITHPAQVLQSLPAALATLLDPADCGPAFIALPQDVQGWTYDYPLSFFDRKVHRIRRQTPDVRELQDALKVLKDAKRPAIIAGGGVQYSRAVKELISFAEATNIPVIQTIAGRANLLEDHKLNLGPVGVTGSESGNWLAKRADVILSVGSRLQDFTTGSWTAFAPDAKFISLNTARHDATKHMALSLVGDAKLGLKALENDIGQYQAPPDWTRDAQAQRQKWDSYVLENTKVGNRPNSYAQAIGVINAICHPRDRIVAAAGGLVGDAKLGLKALENDIGQYQAPPDWTRDAQAQRQKWDSYVLENTKVGNRPNSYAQAIGVINAICHPRDRIVAAAGGLPAEVTANWRTLDIGTVDVEFGFSCMGYEIAGGWGARIAQSEVEPEQDTIVFTGDGSYMLMNSDIYSSVLTGKKLIVLVLDNGGFAVINKLQNNTGNESFNNLIADCPTVAEPFSVDFVAHWYG